MKKIFIGIITIFVIVALNKVPAAQTQKEIEEEKELIVYEYPIGPGEPVVAGEIITTEYDENGACIKIPRIVEDQNWVMRYNMKNPNANTK